MICHDVTQGSDAWFKLRAGRPTSSEFSSLITGEGKPSTSLKKYANKLAAEKYLDSIGSKISDGFQGNKYTDRGIELEPMARADYEMENQVSVVGVGFVSDDLIRYGSSTDGMVGDDGLVEFKNLIATTFFEALVYWKRYGKTEPKYKPQCQGELMITERKWVDLVLYNPDYPDPITERMYPDLEYQATLKNQLIACIVERDRLLEIVNADS